MEEIQESQGPMDQVISVTFKYKLNSKEGPSCLSFSGQQKINFYTKFICKYLMVCLNLEPCPGPGQS